MATCATVGDMPGTGNIEGTVATEVPFGADKGAGGGRHLHRRVEPHKLAGGDARTDSTVRGNGDHRLDAAPLGR